MKPTALRMLSRALDGPDTDDVEALTAWAALASSDARRAEVAAYVLAAAQGGQLGPDGGHGSLKHLLWWLRDHAGSLYEPAALVVLSEAVASTWPLGAAAHHLADHHLVGGLTRQALEADRSADLARHLTWETLTTWRVAWNRTTLNLSKVAFRAGADFYAAVSTDGGCLMARRGLTIEAFPCADGWVQPYPNLVVLRRAGTLVDEAAMRAWLTGAAS